MTTFIRWQLCLALFLLPIVPACLLAGPAHERGLPQLKTFLPEDYNADSQNTAIVRDSSGVIYVANAKGILEYNGVSWMLHRHPDHRQPLSLTIDSENRLFSGWDHDIALLVPDGQSGHVIRSLASFLPDSVEPSAIWVTFATPDGIVFENWNSILIWHPENDIGDEGHFTVISFPPGESYSRYTYQQGQHIIARTETGLMTLNGDQLELLPGGEFFKGLHPFEITALDRETLLVGSLDKRNRRLWHTFADGVAKRFDTPVADFAQQFVGFEANRLNDTLFTMITEADGLALFNRAGEILAILDRGNGLPHNVAHTSMIDPEGGLWIPLDHGIVRLDIQQPITCFGLAEGLDGSVFATTRHLGRLYAATDRGVFQLQPSSSPLESARFKRLPGLNRWTWALLSARGKLIVAESDSLFELDTRSGRRRLLQETGSPVLAATQDSLHILYNPYDGGLASLRWDGRSWRDQGYIEGTGGEIGWICGGRGDEFWVTVDDSYLERIRLQVADNGKLQLVERTRFSSESGLPEIDFHYPFLLHGRLYNGTRDGLFRFDQEHQRFERDSLLLDTGFRELKGVSHPVTDQQGRIWFHSEPWHGLLATPQPYGRYLISAPLHTGRNRSYYSLFPEADGIVWMGGAAGMLLRYDEAEAKPPQTSYSALLRRIVVHGSQPRTIIPDSSSPLVLKADDSSIRIEYAIPRYHRPGENEFQFRMNGLNTAWSAWSREGYHDFEELNPGRYIFEVRGRDGRGSISEIAGIAIQVKPPWQRAWYAYLIYLLLLAGVIYLVSRIRLAQVHKRNHELEQLIHERTRSLEASLESLEHEIAERERVALERSAYQEKFNQSQRLESVGRLAGGLAHDFNNMLSVIHGHANIALTDRHMSSHLRTELTLILGTAERASHLIRDLLTYSRGDSRELAPVRIDKLINQLLPMLDRLLAPRCELKLEFAPNLKTFLADSNQLEQVILNLAINARDAMPHGGQFTLTGSNFIADDGFCESRPKANPGEYVQLMAVDNGDGIPEEYLSKVFDPFFTTKKKGMGTGLGLASVYSIVDQSGGLIEVESELNRGTAFSLYFPVMSNVTSATVPSETLV